jgi:hypothetical protein
LNIIETGRVKTTNYVKPTSERGDRKEKHTMLGLTRTTMAQLGIQRRVPTKLIFDPLAVAIRLVQRLKMLLGLVDAIRRLRLPFLDFAVPRGVLDEVFWIVLLCHFGRRA